MSQSGMVNVKMVITEEKILSNIEKIQKMINPNSKKQIVELEKDPYFNDLIESIKTYLGEYPEIENFPREVYNAAYELVEYATSQFEENTRAIEDLIRQREKNISLAYQLKDLLGCVERKDLDWKKKVQDASTDYSEEIIDTLGSIGRAKTNTSLNYLEALKLLNSKVANLESNFHIEIDLERIEDRSKALSYIGIEIADSLKTIPAPSQIVEEVNLDIAQTGNEQGGEVVQELENLQDDSYMEDTRIEVKASIWDRIKNMKLIRSIRYVMKIKVVLELPALPEGNSEQDK